MVSVSEGDGTVEVCATLSTGAGVTTAIPVDISLETSDGMPHDMVSPIYK